MKVASCCQCGKCSAACPVNFAMDILPHQMVHLVHLERLESVQTSEALWLCIQCGSCTSGCPSGIDLTNTIQELRVLAQNQFIPGHEDQRRLHLSFLRSIERHGRVYDTGLLVRALRAQDKKSWKLVWPAFTRGKIRIWPSRAESRLEIKGYFKSAWTKVGGRHA